MLMDYTLKIERIENPEIDFVFGEEVTLIINEIGEGEITLNGKVVSDRKIIFDPPFKIVGFKNDDKDEYTVTFDFGMTLYYSSLDSAPYGTALSDPWHVKMINNVKFELYHSFFHTTMDPNYGPVNYAIWGCLNQDGRCKPVNEDSLETRP